MSRTTLTAAAVVPVFLAVWGLCELLVGLDLWVALVLAGLATAFIVASLRARLALNAAYDELEKDLATSAKPRFSTEPVPGLVAYQGATDTDYLSVSDADLGRLVDEILRDRRRRDNFVTVSRDSGTSPWFQVTMTGAEYYAEYSEDPDGLGQGVYGTHTTDIHAVKRALIGWAHESGSWRDELAGWTRIE